MKRGRKSGYFVNILVAEGVGLFSGLLSGDIKSEYEGLNQPVFSPPFWVFAAAWVALFACMGIAITIIAQSVNVRPEEKGQATVLYMAQLFVFFWWPILFFRGQYFFVSLLFIILLDLLVTLAISSFKHIEHKAALFMAPYLLWILFATYFNLGTALLN